MAKLIKKQISHTQDGWDKVAELQEANGFTNLNETVRYAISFTHNKRFPDYVVTAKERANKTPEDKANEKIEVKEAIETAKEKRQKDKAQQAIEFGREICLTLRGEEYPDKNGNPKCRYYSYAWLNPKNASVTERNKYLDELTLEDADMQYYNDAVSPKQPMPADQVIATLVELGVTDPSGKPL